VVRDRRDQYQVSRAKNVTQLRGPFGSATERIKLEFSGNATNVLNHPSFALPDKAIGPGHIGKITGTSVGARQMELIAKLRF
jgi:hypothetical protein